MGMMKRIAVELAENIAGENATDKDVGAALLASLSDCAPAENKTMTTKQTSISRIHAKNTLQRIFGARVMMNELMTSLVARNCDHDRDTIGIQRTNEALTCLRAAENKLADVISELRISDVMELEATT